MRERIGRYRRAPIGAGGDPVIGCLFVRDVRFFPAGAIADPPPPFAPSIVQGKSYDLADPLNGLLQDALALPVFGGGNLGVRRRGLHALIQSAEYDPLASSDVS